MKNIDIILIIVLSLILLCFILFILYKYLDGKISNILFRIDDASKSFYDKLEVKNSLLSAMISYSQDKLKIKSKVFNQITKIKNIDLTSDEILNKGYSEILKIVEDNIDNKDINKLKNYIKKYEENELHIISLRTYYNKYALIYNNTIKKFPYILVSKLKKYKLISLYDGEELSLENEKTIEV